MTDSSPRRGHHDHHRPPRKGSRLLHPFRSRRSGVPLHPDHVVVQLSGEITRANAERVGKNLQDVLRSRPAVLEIDLGRVTCLSNDGTTAFFMALRAARTAEPTRVIATHVGPQPRRTLHELGLTRTFDVYEGDGPGGP
ncbi:STAS domain-containing protein [Streptomyces mirabilis]|uniref:STAS domain-containing protein n=1 Tax=Streptomyces mirabilis TaxID=68239 RepID=UPI0036C16920